MTTNYFANGHSDNQNRSNQTNQTNQTNSRSGLTNTQVYLLELYSSQYNEIMRQINARYREANEIRNMMNLVISHQTQLQQPQQQQRQRQNNLDAYTNYALNNAYNNINTRNNNLRSDIPYSTSTSNLLRTFLNSVPIVPTTSQIARATRQCQFLEIADPPNERCPISLELFRPTDTVTQIIYCEHAFNPAQIATWFRSNVVCPVCRYDIRNYTPATQNNPSNSESKEETETGEETKEPDSAVIREPNNNSQATTDASDNLTQLLLNVISESIAAPPSARQTRTSTSQEYSLDPSDNVYLMEFLFRY